jgi:hypothetical protein
MASLSIYQQTILDKCILKLYGLFLLNNGEIMYYSEITPHEREQINECYYIHDVIQGNFTHGMQVFIKAEIENHAGLKSVLRSKVLIIDHTAPFIQNMHGFIKYEQWRNHVLFRDYST